MAKKRKKEKGERGGKARGDAYRPSGPGLFIDQKTGRIIEITRAQEGGYFRHTVVVT